MMPSARHYFEHCPGPGDELANLRSSLCLESDISFVWWTSQPAITSKSAWLTLGADPCPKRRATLQIAVAEFMIAVCELIDVSAFYVEGDEDEAWDAGT